MDINIFQYIDAMPGDTQLFLAGISGICLLVGLISGLVIERRKRLKVEYEAVERGYAYYQDNIDLESGIGTSIFKWKNKND